MLKLVKEDAMEWFSKASVLQQSDEDIVLAALENNPESAKYIHRSLLQNEDFQNKLNEKFPEVYKTLKETGKLEKPISNDNPNIGH